MVSAVLLVIPIAMIEERLKLMQWLSPAFPVGSFAYSHGLEQVIARGDVYDAQSLGDWISDVLEFGAGRADAILLCAALRDESGVADMAKAVSGSAERWRETIDQGRAFLAATNEIYGETLQDMALPVAVGSVARRLSLPHSEIAAIFLHSFVSNLVSVATRFMPLGQAAGQAVLTKLHALVAGVAAEAAHTPVDELATSVFCADMAAIEHETLQPRMFRT
ncbi:MAG: urease accessory UreF family protein [Litoreibacter sp.]